MALQKDTKTVLLHAGMQDHVDDFLIESPAVEYVENGRFDKDGVISKRNGFEALESNGLDPDDDGAPTLIAGGNSLVVPHKSGISVYSTLTEDWSEVDSPSRFASTSRRYSTEASAGACHYHHVTIPGIADSTVIVYERNSDANLLTGNAEVVIEVLDALGRLVSKTVLDGYYPQVVVPGNAPICAVVTYLDGSNLKTVRVNANSAGSSLSATRTTALDIGSGEGGKDLPIMSEALLDGGTPATFNYNGWRAFMAWAPARKNYKLISTSTGAAVIYVEEVSSGAPEVRRRSITANSSTAAPTVSGETVVFTPTAPNAGRNPSVLYTQAAVLAAAEVSGTIYTLIRVMEPAEFTTTSKGLTTKTILTDGTNTQTLRTTTSRATDVMALVPDPEGITYEVPACGTVYADETLVWAAVTYVGSAIALSSSFTTFLASDLGTERPPFTRIFTCPTNLGSATTRHTRFGWRVASNFADDGDGVVLALQQTSHRYMAACEPTDTLNGDGQPTEPVLFSTPRSTILCAVTLTTLAPIAVVGANKSQTVHPADAALSTTLPSLETTDTGWQLLNPVVEEAALVRFTVDRENINTLTNYSSNVPLSTGSRRAELWQITDQTAPRPLTIGSNYLFASGLALWFDGQALFETTPLCSPDVLWAEPIGTEIPHGHDPSAVDDAGYRIYTQYTYVDKQGVSHRSPPSPITVVNAPAPDLNPAFNLYVTSPVSALPPGQDMLLEVYALSEGSYKRIATKSIATQGHTTYSDVQVVVKVRDDMKLASKLLYTEGGVLPADVIPACTGFVSAAGRLFGVTDDPRSTLIYSKTLESNVSPEFPAAFTFPLPQGLTVTGVAGLDDKVAVFSPDDIHVVYGQGPTNNGRGGAFGVLRLPTPVGCTDPQSIVETPQGVMFRGRRGFYLLGRDLVVTPVHGASDILEGRVVVNATTLTKYGEVRFLLETTGTTLDSDGPDSDSTRPPTPKYGNSNTNNPALVYNYERNQWSVFSNYDGVSAALLDGEYCRLRSDYSVWKETPGEYSDPSGSNLLKIITPWIKLRNLQDFGRIYKATFLGRYLSTFTEDDNGDLDAGDITIKAAYDYEKNDTQTKVWRASEELQPELRDGQSVGADRLQVVFVPKRQKCSAIRFTLEETPTADADGLTYRTGRGWEIPAIDLEVGMRPGSNKSLSAQRKK